MNPILPTDAAGPSASPVSAPPQGQIAALFSPESKRRTNLAGVLYPVADLALYYLCIFAIAHSRALWFQILISGAILPILLSRLFVLGHDLTHKILAESKTINVFFGRWVFIPTLHTFSLWELYHNVYHHGFSNIRKKDYAWAPWSPEEYRQAPWIKKALYRLERTVLGHGVWTIAEHIVPRMLFPNAKYIDKPRGIYTLDSLLVLAANAGLTAGALALNRWFAYRNGIPPMPSWELVALVLVLPWLVFSWLFGWMIFIQHTGPEVPWYDAKTPLNYLDHQKSVTPDWHFPFWFGWLFHFIHVHTAHHVNAKIPAYNLNRAQAELRGKSPERMASRKWTVWVYFDSVRRCKTYDFENKRWCDFRGNPTGPKLDFS